MVDLPPGEDLALRAWMDRYLVEVFANNRRVRVAAFPVHAGRMALNAFTVGAPTRMKQVEGSRPESADTVFYGARVCWVREPPPQ